MKKLSILLAGILMLVVTCGSVLALGDTTENGDGSPSASVEVSPPIPAGEALSINIDNENIYPGMDSAYKNGYVPKVEKLKVSVVLPLIAAGQVKDDKIIVTPNFGNTVNSPFVYKNYEKTIYQSTQTINNSAATAEVYYVLFEFDLNKDYYRGIYPIVFQAKASSADNVESVFTFTSYVTLTGGKDPNAQPTPEVPVIEKPVSPPAIIVAKHVAQPKPAMAGEEVSVTVTLKNLNDTQDAQNIVLTVTCADNNFSLLEDSNIFYFAKIEKDAEKEFTVKYKTDYKTPNGRYDILLAYTFENKDSQPLSGNGTVSVDVRQKILVQAELPKIPTETYAGEIVPLLFNFMNLGNSVVYNARCVIEGEALFPSNTAFAGNIQPGASAQASLNLFFGTKDSITQESKFGQTQGTITFTYNDEFGEEYTEEHGFIVNISEPVITGTVVPPEPEPENRFQWWVSIVIAAGCLIAVSVVFLIIKRRQKNAY